MTTINEQVKKNKTLRYNEYYDMQSVFDELYELGSSKKHKFYNLMDLITSESNILLAYRKIKRNKGSKTAGTNKKTIIDIAESNPKILIEYVRNRLENYNPNSVKRVEIPKPNGKTRPLGIPTIGDRLIQQCIKQILEPICEAKFYKHSYGFRPDRSTEHAIGRFDKLIHEGYHYVVDIDIKGFFDNVNHGKLLKQIWSLGIRDKKLIAIISRMLKAEIKGIGIPDKGTPQGGILSPLLANIVLNELDFWIASQWDTFPTKHKYALHSKYKCESGKYSAMRNTNLKEIRIVRYADDFKIMCKDYKTAQKIFIATKMWLKERLSLEISPEKSKITNLRKNYSEFLGFRFKTRKIKANKYTVRSRMLEKAKERAIEKLKIGIKNIVRHPEAENVSKYNSIVLGLQNYYQIATMVNIDFHEIAYKVSKSLKCRTKQIRADTGILSKAYTKFYGKYKYKKMFIAKIALFQIAGVKFRKPTRKDLKRVRYTSQGRELIHASLKMDMKIMRYLMENPIQGQTVEYNDNRLSLYAGQNGKCAITGEHLEIGSMEVHHKKPKFIGGTDEYKNLIFVTANVHKLIHATIIETIQKYFNRIKFDSKGLEKLNKLRLLVGNDVIPKFIIDGTPYEVKVSCTV